MVNSFVHFLRHDSRKVQDFADRVTQDALDVLRSVRDMQAGEEAEFPSVCRRMMVKRASGESAFLEVTTSAIRLKTGQVGIAYDIAQGAPDKPVPQKFIGEVLADITQRMENALQSDRRFLVFDERQCDALNARIDSDVRESGLFSPDYAPREIKNPQAEHETRRERCASLYRMAERRIWGRQGNEASLALVTAPMERGMGDAMAPVIRHIIDRVGNIPYGACWAEGAEEELARIIERHIPEGRLGYSQQRSAEQCRAASTNAFAVSGSDASLTALENALAGQLRAAAPSR